MLVEMPAQGLISAGSARDEAELSGSTQRSDLLCVLPKQPGPTLFSQWATTSSSHLVWDSTCRFQWTEPSGLASRCTEAGPFWAVWPLGVLHALMRTGKE